MASVFMTHGGGSMPLIYKEDHAVLYKQFQDIQTQFPKPKAILLFSAHWEEHQWTIIDHDIPPLYYDYYGFPAQAYNLTYPIKSSAQLRNHVKAELKKQEVYLKTNTKRGYDHGVFIPMMIMYPQADVPIIQISILKSLNPETHFRMGVALRGLKEQGFLIIGSGSSCHGGFGQPQSVQISRVFDTELMNVFQGQKSKEQLLNRIKAWKKLKYSQIMHPRQEHLVPLFLNAGAGSGKNPRNLKVYLMGVHLSNFVFE